MRHDYFIAGVRTGDLYSGHTLVESFFDKPCSKLWRYESNGILIRSSTAPKPEGSAMVTRDICYPTESGQTFLFTLTTIPARRKQETQKSRTPLPWDAAAIKRWFYERCTKNGFIPMNLAVDAIWTVIERKDIRWQRALATYTGRLKVLDLKLFTTALNEGMTGSDRAFGCSLLTISPLNKDLP